MIEKFTHYEFAFINGMRQLFKVTVYVVFGLEIVRITKQTK